MTGKFLRIVRIIVSVVAFGILTCGLTCSALLLPGVGPWLERIQLGAAVLSFSMVIFVGWLLVTLALGRVYCSTVCPVGTLQDVCSRVPRMRPLAKYGTDSRRYRYARPATRLRYVMLGVTLICLMAGFMIIPSLIEPYMAYERICSDLFRPLLKLIVPGLTCMGIGNEHVAIFVTGTATATAIAAVLAVSIALLSIRFGRRLCNTVCPVGTALGCVSRFSIYQMDINTDLCVNCGLCEDVCKAHCIDLKDHTVDGSRCVVCFDCMAVCPNNAIRYTRSRHRLSTPMMQRIAGLGREPETSLNCRSDMSVSQPQRNE